MGGKSGGGARTPYEAPNTLSSAQNLSIIDAVCEGTVAGFANGNDAPLKSVFFNDTPVQNSDGSYNFHGITAYFLRGEQDQAYVPGFDGSERTVAVSAAVKHRTPIVRGISDGLVSRLRVTVGVERNVRVEDNGDTHPANTSLLIELVGSGGVQEARTVSFSEKSGGAYYQDVVFDSLPRVPFNIRVSRPTPDSTNDRTSNNTFFASYVEIVDAKLCYPHTAIAALKIDSDQFGNQIPRRNYLMKGKLVKVPANYDPETRTYTGATWDGSFKTAWTNNPAWVFYDLLTNPRYSTLARRLKVSEIDKWSLYAVAKYCDEPVPDGFGGQEPRFVCNAYITNARQAGELLTDLASVFTGLPVWNGNQVSVVLDSNTDPVAQYTNGNVVNGEFVYGGAPLKSIHTAVHVQYLDKYDGYRAKTEYIADDEAIKRYGLNIKQVTAFGCDSRGQAARFGAWTLETELRQQNTVTFTVGREGLRHLPYDIIQIADNAYASAEIGGRIAAANGTTVTLDREVDAAAGMVFQTATEQGVVSAKVAAVPAKNTLRLDKALNVEAGGVWVLSGKVSPRLYRAVGIKENAEEGTYTINALYHDPKKYPTVDGWAAFDRERHTLHTLQPELLNAALSTENGSVVITWDNLTAGGAVLTYDIKIYRNNRLFRHIPDADTPEIRLENLPNGDYRAEIRGRNARGVLSEPLVKAWSLNYAVTGLKTTQKMLAVQIDWTPPAVMVNDAVTELWYGPAAHLNQAKKLASLPYPQSSYTLQGVAVTDRFYFWARIVDRAGNSGEFTAPVLGRSDPDPAPIVSQIQGSITKSALSQSLIEAFDRDMAAAARAEADKAKNAAVADAAGKIQAEAAARVVAVRAAAAQAAADLADKAAQIDGRLTAHAQQINTVTAAQANTVAGLEAEKKARADGDKAEAAARQTLVTRIGAAEGSISEIRQSVTDETRVRTEQHNRLSARFNGLSAGGRNLLRGSGEAHANTNYPTHEYALTEPPAHGEDFTLTLWGELGEGKTDFAAYNSGGNVQLGRLKKVSDGLYRLSGKWAVEHATNPALNAANRTVRIYPLPHSVRTESRIAKIKLERGTIPSDWTAAPEEQNAADAQLRADFEQYRTAEATKDQAAAREVAAVKSQAAGVQAAITQTRETVARLDGHVRSAYGLKVETIAGGRKVAAGVQLGVDGQTADSQVLIYANKFGLVDPQSKNVRVPFVVQNENGQTKMVLDGDMIASGTVHARHLVAGLELQAPAIRGGHASFGNGKTVIDYNGNLWMNQGARVGMRVSSDAIEVYDEHGNLKVKIGKLR